MPPGKLPRIAIEEPVEPHGADRLLHPVTTLGSLQRLALQRERDVLTDRHPGIERAAVLLEDERHLLRAAVDLDAAQAH
jgi:hypothetical protein